MHILIILSLVVVLVFRHAVNDLLSSPERDDWKKQHGGLAGDFTIYYKIEDGAKLTCRVESPIPSNLLVPLLSVLNEVRRLKLLLSQMMMYITENKVPDTVLLYHSRRFIQTGFLPFKGRSKWVSNHRNNYYMTVEVIKSYKVR